MKKLLIVTLAALLALAALPVRAQEGATILATLPAEIETFFSQSHFADYTIGANAYVEITGTRGGDFAFAVASKGETQALYGFERQNGAWRYYLKTTAALPQQAGEFALWRFVDSGEDYLHAGLTLPETGVTAVVEKAQASSLEYRVDLPETLAAPIQQGQQVGTLTLCSGDTELLTVPILAAEDAAGRSWGRMFTDLLKMAVFTG